MRRFPHPAALLALATLLAATRAAPTVRQVETRPATSQASAISNTSYTLITSSAPGCADSISHGVVSDVPITLSEDVEGLIFFSDIRMNDFDCDSGEEDQVMELLSKDALDRLFPEGGAVLNLTFEASRAIVISAADNSKRMCGTYVDDILMSYAFVEDIRRLLPSLLDSGFIDNTTIADDIRISGENWMVAAPKENPGRVCLYADVTNPSLASPAPSPTPTPTAAPTPPPEEPVPDAPTVPAPAPTAEDTVFEEANEAAADGGADEDESACFPADASVRVEGGGVKRVADLEIGEKVLVGDGVFSEVFMFTHRVHGGMFDFVRVVTEDGDSVLASAGHYVYVNGGLAAMGSVAVGDVLELGNGGRSVITEVSIERAKGLFNPQTVHGDIIVDNIRASTYTTTIDPKVAHALLTPLRALYARFFVSLTCFDDGASVASKFVPRGQLLY